MSPATQTPTFRQAPADRFRDSRQNIGPRLPCHASIKWSVYMQATAHPSHSPIFGCFHPHFLFFFPFQNRVQFNHKNPTHQAFESRRSWIHPFPSLLFFAIWESWGSEHPPAFVEAFGARILPRWIWNRAFSARTSKF